MKKQSAWAPAILVVIVLIVAGILLVPHSPPVTSNNSTSNSSIKKTIPHTPEEINNYKRALFQSLECQYSCSPENITMNNETRFLPNPVCIKACTAALKAKNLPAPTEFNQTEMMGDDLFKDIELAHTNCTSSNTNQTSGERLETSFFECMSEQLKTIKSKYSYVQ
jgi:hypothetical protein